MSRSTSRITKAFLQSNAELNILDYTGPAFMLPSDGRHQVYLDVGPVPFLSNVIYRLERQVWMLGSTKMVSGSQERRGTDYLHCHLSSPLEQGER